MSSTVIPVILLIAFFGLLAFGAVAAFVVSVQQQRKYNTTSLPDINVVEEEVFDISDEDNEVIPESRFESFDDALVLEDEESNELMKKIVIASGNAPATTDKKSSFSFTSPFKRNGAGSKKEEGAANADSK